jgi:S-adenosylmethionine synthetase
MIRVAEAVLPGHPDKFCDQIADQIVADALRIDPQAFVQAEVGIWSDQVWLSGAIITREPFPSTLEQVVIDTGLSLGFNQSNWIDANRYKVTNTLCASIADPTDGRNICDDQSIVIGYAGYDALTHYLPPEQFLVHALADAMWQSCRGGRLIGAGPDGKVLAVMRDEPDGWTLESLLVTIQHSENANLLDVIERVQVTLRDAYQEIVGKDRRWKAAWSEIVAKVNPNGPYFRAGSDGDNGQTGRKLVMDFYGPRVPIGGGALSGKHPGHIDRLAAYAARSAALYAVKTGAKECQVQIAYAPGRDEPLELAWNLDGRGERKSREWFGFNAMLSRLEPEYYTASLGQGKHFWDLRLPWNS